MAPALLRDIIQPLSAAELVCAQLNTYACWLKYHDLCKRNCCRYFSPYIKLSANRLRVLICAQTMIAAENGCVERSWCIPLMTPIMRTKKRVNIWFVHHFQRFSLRSHACTAYKDIISGTDVNLIRTQLQQECASGKVQSDASILP